eukprot:6974244-Prorocentrum_lima.AAC.1
MPESRAPHTPDTLAMRMSSVKGVGAKILQSIAREIASGHLPDSNRDSRIVPPQILGAKRACRKPRHAPNHLPKTGV